MTYFEFVSVALSLIFALAMADIFRSIVPSALAPARYWPHLGWLVSLFLLTIYIWLNVWKLRGIPWTGLHFLYAFVNPALMTVMARLLTTSNPESIDSFRDHFLRVRRPFFVIFLVFAIFGFLFAWLVGRVPFGTVTLPQYGALGAMIISVAGLFVKSDVSHRILVSVTIILLVTLIASVPAAI